MLGSEGGDCANQWRENVFFLSLHREMIGAATDTDWTRKVFDIDFISRVALDDRARSHVNGRLDRELLQAYPSHQSKPWHWKCPTATLFLDFWLDVFPDAWLVHITRDPLDVAKSLMSRRQCYTIRSALAFYEEMESRIQRVATAYNYIKLNYESLAEELDRLGAFLPFLDLAAIGEARKLIRPERGVWKPGRSMKRNLWNAAVALRVALAKKSRH
jgi:hypothetical protein